jgi:hypothetical protein
LSSDSNKAQRFLQRAEEYDQVFNKRQTPENTTEAKIEQWHPGVLDKISEIRLENPPGNCPTQYLDPHAGKK